MKFKILRTLATAMMVMLCAAVFAVAAEQPAPLAPTPVQSVQTPVSNSAPAAFEVPVNVSTANADRAVNPINYSVIEKSMTGITANADAHDNQIINRRLETNDLPTIVPPNISQFAFNPTVNRSEPVPKTIVTGDNNQRFYRRE